MAQTHLRKIRREADKVDRAEAALRRAIVQAKASGETVRDIAPWARLSPSRVQQILTEETGRASDT